MAKLPFMKFYPSDWTTATRVLPMLLRGQYITLLCDLWINSNNGRHTYSITGLETLWGCEKTEVRTTLNELAICGCIGLKLFEHGGVETAEILQRRIHRDKKKLDNQAIRQKRYNARMTLVSRSSDENSMPKKSEVRSQKSDKDLPPLPPRGKPRPPEDFENFWKAYPKKVGKGAAEKAWGAVFKDREGSAAFLEVVLRAVEAQKLSAQWTKEQGQFIPNPATWLNQRRWEDEAVVIDKDAEFEKEMQNRRDANERANKLISEYRK